MIRVTVSKNAEGVYDGVCLEGHAGFAEFGQDIVCAAVSALVINTINSIEQFTNDKFSVEENQKADRFEFKMVSSMSEETKLLFRSLLLGLEGIKEEYGKKYIKIFFNS